MLSGIINHKDFGVFLLNGGTRGYYYLLSLSLCVCMRVQEVFMVYDIKMSFSREQILLVWIFYYTVLLYNYI